ncbi:MAG TPA: DsbA family protein [Phenylobacterium sp.]|jgi:protein-disulfide isomerase|nr:DsbA family protein [Phenylobacterium sp.]
MLNRRFALAAVAGLAIVGAGLGATQALAAAPPASLPDDMSLGNPKAKVQVIEYASLSCPHCGHFNETIFAPFKAKWIDTGKAHYTLREMLTDPMQVAAAGFMVARCAGPTKYFAVVDQVFRSQPRWSQGNIKPIFQEIAAANGVDEAHFNACLQDQAAFDAINARAARASDQDDVHSTPTVFINGKKLDAIPQTPAEMDAAIAAALKGGG